MTKLMKSKKGLAFDRLAIGFLVFSGAMMFCLFMINDMDTNYAGIANLTGANDSFTGVYNTLDDITGDAQSIKNATLDADITKDEANDGAIASMTRGAYSAVRLVKNSFGLLRNILEAIAGTVGIECGPDTSGGTCFFIDLVIIALIITVVFSLIYMIFRFIPK